MRIVHFMREHPRCLAICGVFMPVHHSKDVNVVTCKRCQVCLRKTKKDKKPRSKNEWRDYERRGGYDEENEKNYGYGTYEPRRSLSHDDIGKVHPGGRR